MENVLLTGFPGLLAERLVRSCQEANITVFWHVIVRPEEASAAAETFRELGLNAAEFVLYPGDLAQHDLGLSDEDAQLLRERIERCFHLASLMDPGANAEDLERANVWSTRNVLEFLKGCANLRRVNYASTCFVSGMLDGKIPEQPLDKPPAFNNAWERSRWEAESRVYAETSDVPATVFRLGMLVGDSQTGETSVYDGPYFLMRFFRWGQRTFYWMPNLGSDTAWMHAVPVDFAAAVLRDVGFSDEDEPQTLHVTDPAPPTTAESYNLMYHQVSGRFCFAVSRKVKETIIRISRCFPFDALTGVPGAWMDYFDHRATFQTEQLEKTCARHDIPMPDWREYYKPVIKFALLNRCHAPNAACIREFKMWCSRFRLLYFVTALFILLAPNWVIWALSLFDSEQAAEAISHDNLLWRPLGVSLLAGLFVAVTSLEKNPFQKPLHILIFLGKFISCGSYLLGSLYFGAISLFLAFLIDGIIGATHLLFYYRLRRIQPMAGSEYSWAPFHLLFPDRFISDFTQSMAPKIEEPINVGRVTAQVQDHVSHLPFLVRYAFLAVCYYTLFLMPCLCGFPPYILMRRDQRDAFFRHVERMRAVHLRLPLMLVKMICCVYLYKEEAYLRSIGAE